MTPEAAFLSDILEHPHDDDRRLIFADWLDDHGAGPRAAFLRVQVELASCFRDPDRREALRATERALLAQHYSEWLATLGVLVGLAPDVRFERGLAQVTMTATDYLSLLVADALSRAWTQTLRLTDVGSSLPAVLAAQDIKDVSCLDLDGNNLGDDGVGEIVERARDGRWQRLDLGNNQIGDAGAMALAGSGLLRRLTGLDLHNNRVTAAGVRALLRAAGQRLSWLDLDGNAFAETDVPELADWRRRRARRPWSGTGPPRLRNSISLELVRVPAGRFLMGSPDTEAERNGDEGPQHPVTLTKDFWFAIYPLTQAQYERVVGTNPAHYRPPEGSTTHPIECVSWHDAVAFCRALSALPAEKAAGRVYRLPTEAEWEHACRADCEHAFGLGPTLSSFQANFDGGHPYGGARPGPFVSRTTAVGSYQPNAWGIYDMHGNVWDWCSDWYDDAYYERSPPVDPVGPPRGPRRVLRGGSWYLDGKHCRSANRSNNVSPETRQSFYGFRVALDLTGG
jgi:uncharacterized protein (TIGR02996 family)